MPTDTNVKNFSLPFFLFVYQKISQNMIDFLSEKERGGQRLTVISLGSLLILKRIFDLWYGRIYSCYIAITIMISITTVLQIDMQIQSNKNTQADSVVPDTNGLLTSCLLFFDTRKETQFLLCWPYYLTPPTRCAPKNPTTSSSLNCMAETQLSASVVQCQPSTHSFSKIPNFSGPSLPDMTSSTLQPYFLSGGLIWQWWLLYPLRTSVNCTNWLYAWTLNPKPNQSEW